MFETETQQEIIEAYTSLLLLLKESSYSSGLAKVFLQTLEHPDFTSEFWTKFSTNYKKLLETATKYTQLTNENPSTQLEVKRWLSVIRMINPLDFVAAFKAAYLAEHNDDLAKKKLRVFIDAYVTQLPPGLIYQEVANNDYTCDFSLTSVDQKRSYLFTCDIDQQNNITVFGSAKYKDFDFEFEIDQIKFDCLLFPTLVSCVRELMNRLDLRTAMKVNGTRLRIASYVLILSKRDLALARANLLNEGGITTLYALTGEKLVVTKEPVGRLLDSMNTAMLGSDPSLGEKLYFYLEENVQELQEETAREKPEAASVVEKTPQTKNKDAHQSQNKQQNAEQTQDKEAHKAKQKKSHHQPHTETKEHSTKSLKQKFEVELEPEDSESEKENKHVDMNITPESEPEASSNGPLKQF